jgi:hypothetical protein
VSIQGAGAAVFWVPGSEAADSYRVYGIADNGAKTLLEQNVTQPSVPVPAGFHAYAVSSVKGGIESDPVTALGTCVEISIQPPAVRVCFTAGRAKAEVETNILE